MRSPSEFYIRYLICLPGEDYTDDDIYAMLVERELDPISVSYINEVRRTMRIPDSFNPYSRQHLASQRFLVRERIEAMFFPTRDVRLALHILERPPAKEDIEAMLMVYEPPVIIAERLKRHGRNYTPESVYAYAHYFWNLGLVTKTEIQVLLRARIEHRFLNAPTPALQAAWEKAKYVDMRLAIASAPSAPLARMQLRVRLGLRPQRIEFSHILESARQLAGGMAVASLSEMGQGAAIKAREYATVMRIAHETLQDTLNPDDQVEQHLATLAVATAEHKIPHLDTLEALPTVSTSGEDVTDVPALPEHVGA